MKKVIFAVICMVTSLALAHEGHDKTPGASPHPGGIVEGKGQINLELVVKPDGIQIYPFDHDMKPLPMSEVELAGTVAQPKKGKPEAIKFTKDKEAFVANVVAKGSRRIVDVSVEHKGKKEKIKFNVEPQ